jgi:hypothetical protein
VDHTDFEAAFRGRTTFFPTDAPPMRVGARVVGASGRIACGDPRVGPGVVLERPGPPGPHEVSLALIELPRDQRVAAARVRLAPGAPVRWELATGFGVDSGTAGVADARAASRLTEPRVQEGLRRALDETWRHTWAVATLPLATGANVVAFTAGLGDGQYIARWGLDPLGTPIVLDVEFDLLAEPDLQEEVLDWSPDRGVGALPVAALEAHGVRLEVVRTQPAAPSGRRARSGSPTTLRWRWTRSATTGGRGTRTRCSARLPATGSGGSPADRSVATRP